MQAPARYLVIIDSDGASTAMLFNAQRVRVADFDAGSTTHARAEAVVYELDV